MSKCNLIHLWWGGKFHWKLPPAVTLHSGLPKRPITKYYLHNLLLHNLPLRQSYFPLLSFVLPSRIQFWDGKKNPSAKANDSKVYLFPERREATERSREKKVSNDFQSNAYPPTILLFGCNLSPCYCHAAQLLLLSSAIILCEITWSVKMHSNCIHFNRQ